MRPGMRILPVLVTLMAVGLAAVSAWAAWDAYVAPPWTRDGTVRAYVVIMAPEVSGRVLQLSVADNQLVEKGQLLMVIDPTDYALAVQNAQGNLEQAQATLQNRQAEARRRTSLTNLSISEEERLTYVTGAQAAEAALEQAQASLEQAKVNLSRTRLVSPVSGWVTNLKAREGDYAVVGQRNISVVDRDSFWVDGYFEETVLPGIHEGDRARMRLMGWHDAMDGHVAGVARGIQVLNATADASGLATVSPIFTWVRLAQRVPVRIAIDHMPAGMRLVAGQTASVEIVR